MPEGLLSYEKTSFFTGEVQGKSKEEMEAQQICLKI